MYSNYNIYIYIYIHLYIYIYTYYNTIHKVNNCISKYRIMMTILGM